MNVKKTIILALAAGAIAAALAIPSLGSAGGRLTATISLSGNSFAAASTTGSTGGGVSFDVTRSAGSEEVFWVTNKCYDDSGAMVERMDLPVAWGTITSLNGHSGPFETAGTHCTAYVTMKPWTNRALGSASVDYVP